MASKKYLIARISENMTIISYNLFQVM